MVRPRLPPLNAIKAFEAAVRLGSFTRAAEELNVTHGAVSRQIRGLEDWLGARLFLRTSRNAVPTRAGTDLFAAAGPALDRLAGACLRVQSGAQAQGLLHVSALPTFAMRWLIPRLPEFQRDHPALELRLVTASTAAEQFQMDVDAVISGPARGSGANSRHDQALLASPRQLQTRSTAFQTAGAERPSGPRRPSLNCPLRMRCSSSMPAMVIAAFLKPLKPSITAMRCFTPRWSCSIRLFRYFDERSFVFAGSEPSAFSSRTAR
jgi:DNA-binding transcriptional LysR family regulator